MQDKSVNHNLRINPMTSRAKHYHDALFPQMVDAVERLRRTPLSVFVCGPSKGEQTLPTHLKLAPRGKWSWLTKREI